MACECTNKEVNNNRQLGNKKLRLDSIQGLSIDEIINLYRNGYRLDGLEDFQYDNISNDHKMTSMVASPSFNYVEATKGGIGVMTFITLVNNSGPRGMIRLKAFDKTTGICVEDSAMQTDHCIEASYNAYIPSGLFSLIYAMKFSGSQYNTGCLRAYTCSSGENCDAGTCTTYSTSASATNDNISIGTAAGITPNAITNYTLTPGNGTIIANWTEPNNTSIFAYLIVLTRTSDSTELARGYIRGPSVTIANLTNGTQYSVRIVPVSYDYYVGNGTTQTATPTIPTPVLTTITISPSSASINVGATQQLTAVCKDQNNATMTCPTLTWSSSNPSKATVSSSGLVTGSSAGNTNITASASGVTSNISAIIVNAPTPVLTTITISPTSPSINIGDMVQITAICKDQNNATMTCPTLAWSSSSPSKATVSSSGLVIGVSAGSSNITASASGITSNISNVTITETASVLTSIVISPTSAPVIIGGTRQLTAVCRNQNNAIMTCPTLTWISTDPTKATVNSSGLVSGIAEGTANITANASGITSNSSVMTVSTTLPQESGGGMIVIAAVALAAAMMFAKK